jgi:Synergist-CTERM protein sorting domain-containing protein
MRLRVISVCAVFVLLVAGCSWAGETEVENAITSYGLSRKISETGTTITVEGTIPNATSTLNLGDISGLTIDWQATLTATLSQSTDEWTGDLNDRELILIKASATSNGKFIVNGGKIALLDPYAEERNPDTTYRYQSSNRSSWPRMINLPGVEVEVNGGEIELTTAHGSAFAKRGGNGGTIKIAAGQISVPYGEITGDYSLSDVTLNLGAENGLTGIYSYEDGSEYYSFVYGDVTMLTSDGSQGNGGSQSYEMVITQDGILTWTYPDTGHFGLNCTMTVGSGGVMVVKEGVVLTLDGNLIVKKGGIIDNSGTIIVTGSIILEGGTPHPQLTTIDPNNGILNIYGTLSNRGEITNNGTINNFSGNTLDNQKKLTNKGAIYNGANGKIRNTGSIDNSNGEIDNTAGGTFESVQSASEMGGDIEGPVELINNNTSSGGGCNTGFGLFGLLLLVAFAVYKKHLMA